MKKDTTNILLTYTFSSAFFTGRNYEVSYSQRLSDNTLYYGVNIFYINGDNMIQTINRKNINTGKVEDWGAEASMTYRITHAWNFSTGIQYVSGLYTDIKSETKENFVLWNARGSYHICSFADLFVKGENLLASRYEINAGYPMPKATFMGGVNLNF